MKKIVARQKFTRILEISIAFFLLLISGFACSASKDTKPPLPSSASIPAGEISATSPNATMPQDVSSCVWSSEQIYPEGINSFFWSDDSNTIIFSIESKQSLTKYDLEAKKLQELPEQENVDYFRQPGENLEQIATDFGISNYLDIFLTPDEKSVVILKSADDENSVFLKSKDNENIVPLGKIHGAISEAYWINNGTELLLSIDWLSPIGIRDAYVYRVDLVNLRIDIEIPNRPEYRNLTTIGVTPNNDWLLYVTYAEQDRSVYLHNLTTKVETKTAVQFPPMDYQWLSDDEFLAVGYLKDKTSPNNTSVYAYKYNISRDELTLLFDNPLNVHQFIKNAIQISPSGKLIAFIQAGDQELYVVKCK